MYTEDFILRLIRQVGIVLAHVLGRKAAGEYREAVDAIDTFLEEVVGMDAGLVHHLDDESLLAALSPQGNLDVDRALILADMLKEQAEILDLQKMPQEAGVRRLRALNLYLEAFLTRGAEGEGVPFDKLEEVLPHFDEQTLPFGTVYNLAQYAENLGQYARAERYLLRLAETPEFSPQMEAELNAFYQRLLEQSDSALQLGGLPRETVHQRLGI
jgi:tetratricopeptide (TPR) repeat protein